MKRLPTPLKESDGVRHYFNAHFPGLYSVVLRKRGDLLTRAYIARPSTLHYDLRFEDTPFLWHEHGYDFRETSILGKVENICARPAFVGGAIKGQVFQWYSIKAGIGSGLRPTLRHMGEGELQIFLRHTTSAGESFEMTADVIHRVVFEQCERTGWFCCVVEELRKVTAPSVVYCPHMLTEIPNADELYVHISDEDAAKIVDEVNGLL